MPFQSRTRLVNPRLGTYFSIFASLFAALFLLALIFEELSFSDALLRMGLFLGPLVLYVGIAASVATQEPLEYFASGRRVPAGYSGLLLAISAAGGTLLVCGAGAFFIAGFDALVLMIGGLAGLVFMATLLAPFYRKFGAYTVPSFLGRRFESTTIRILSAIVCSVTILLVLSAELRVGAHVAAQLTGFDYRGLVVLLALVAAVTVASGGKRSFTWAGVAQSVAAVLALAIVAATVATLVTSLPVPQLTHGPLVRNLVRNEVSQGLQLVAVSPFAFDLPAEGFRQIVKPYTAPFGAVGPIAFAFGALMIAAGFAAAPWLLPRAAATPTVYDARKSLGWATVLFGFVMLTVSSVAVFMRDYTLDIVISEHLPAWASEIANLGFARFDASAARPDFTNMAFDRDSVLFALPVAAQLPRAFVYLAEAGALAAVMSSLGATTVALSTILAEDVLQGASWEPASSQVRVWIARAFVGVAALCGIAVTLAAPTDPLRLLLWSLALTSASLFPVFVLSIWWKRLTRNGALIGIAAGFGTAVLGIFAGEAGLFGLPSVIAGVIGLPVSALAAMVVSSLSPERTRHDLEMVRDIRVPGGEIIYDREMRKLHIKKQVRR